MARTQGEDESVDTMGQFETEPGGNLSAYGAINAFAKNYIQSLEGVPRMKKAKENASTYCNQQLRRVLWTCSYWHQVELKDCNRWGFSPHCG